MDIPPETGPVHIVLAKVAVETKTEKKIISNRQTTLFFVKNICSSFLD